MTEPDHTESRSALLPNDTYDTKLLANTRPAGWKNPQPAPSYNLVVLGAGTAGLVTAAGDQPAFLGVARGQAAGSAATSTTTSVPLVRTS